jgi:predicted nucleic acid-binding protein
MPFIDTNILVYCHDAKEPVKQAQAAQLLQQAMVAGELVLSTQILQEFYNTAVGKKLRSPEQAIALCRVWAEFEVVNSTPDLLFRAFELHQRFQLSVWDALVVQAALDSGCTTLYTEDLQHGLRIGYLEIVNPFLQPAAVHEPSPAYAGPGSRRPRASAAKAASGRAARKASTTAPQKTPPHAPPPKAR